MVICAEFGTNKTLYSEEGISSFLGYQAFGIDDHYTAETISKMLGDTTIIVENESYSNTSEGRTFQ